MAYANFSGTVLSTASTDRGVAGLVSAQGATLAPGELNLRVTAWDSFAFGNDLDNIISADIGPQQFYGGLGQDILISEDPGIDRFIVRKGEGNDVIYGFDSNDVVRLSGTPFYSFADLQPYLTQQGSDVVLNMFGGDALLFRNLTVGRLTAANFELGFDSSRLQMTFAEEFDTLSLWNNDGGRWRTDYGYGATRNDLTSRTLTSNNEKQIYVDPGFTGTNGTLAVNPFSIANGVLTIHAAPATPTQQAAIWDYDYTSGLLTTRESFAQTYGYYEIRAAIPHHIQGVWPALWLLPRDGSWPPEIDIVETIGNQTNGAFTTVHSMATGRHTQDGEKDFLAPTADGFHTFGLLWSPTVMTWYIDGAAVHSVPTPADMNKPMYFLANMAIGGSWPGDPAPSFSGADFSIDYVRVYAIDTTVPYTAPPPERSASEAPHSGSLKLLEGDNGFDLLVGGAGNDSVNGDSGNDTLDGGLGDDVLKGSSGRDMFVFRPNSGHDVILDFNPTNEILQLAGFNGYYPNVIAQTGADVLVEWSNGDSLTLMGVTIAQLTPQNVIWT